jgi:outer membrane protein assembly factor BamB
MKSRLPLALAFFAIGCVVLSGDLLAGTWEAFRGPGSKGVAEHQNLPVKFDKQNGLLWEAALPGMSNSSPIVWNDRVLTFTSTDNGSERVLLCFDAKTGKKVWDKSFKGHSTKLHKTNSLASSTPTTDGKAVYVAVWDGNDITIHALDMKGEPLWEKNLGEFKSEHGAGASPILYKDKLIFTLDMDGKSVLYVFDKETGKIAWSAPREAHRACYSMPQILENRPGGDELIVTSTTCITSYNPETGSRNWNWQWPWPAPKGGKKSGLRTIATSLEEKGVLVASSGEGGAGRLAVALKLPTVVGAQPTEVWENKKEFPYIPSGLIHDGHFYFANDPGFVGCWDMKTGKKVWYERMEGAGFIASPILVDGKIYAASEQGDVFVFPAAPKFELLARNAIGERIRATPAVADGRMFVRTDKTLYCFGKKD